MQENRGFVPDVIDEYKKMIADSGKPFVLDDEDESNEEYVHFYFIGKHEGKDVIYDAVLYTLRMHYESELFEIAEHKAAAHFPQYKKIKYEEDENGNLRSLDSLEEEIGLFMAEVIMELEEDETVKVREHVEIDLHADFGISLDVGLHVETITDETVEKFIGQFNQGTLKLDETLYTFEVSDVDSE